MPTGKAELPVSCWSAGMLQPRCIGRKRPQGSEWEGDLRCYGKPGNNSHEPTVNSSSMAPAASITAGVERAAQAAVTGPQTRHCNPSAGSLPVWRLQVGDRGPTHSTCLPRTQAQDPCQPLPLDSGGVFTATRTCTTCSPLPGALSLRACLRPHPPFHKDTLS